jgi:aryl-alcohol dehydrogenase-like predicted oxidoreductase
VRRVRELAEETGCAPVQLATAWSVAQADDVVPVPGTRRAQHLEERVARVGGTLRAEVLRDLDALGAVAGSRCSDAAMWEVES